ncbi:MAG: CHC2 zinc finger domain-containing protein, partial [Dehalococcoidia bacterium]
MSTSRTSTPDILEIIALYSPREYKEYRNSTRSRYRMACPLPGHEGDRQHADKSGSFSVDAAARFYKCFGCGSSGNARKLLEILSGNRPQGRLPIPPQRSAPRPRPRREKPSLQGATIEELAALKALPPTHLRDFLHWEDVDYFGTPAIAIP